MPSLKQKKATEKRKDDDAPRRPCSDYFAVKLELRPNNESVITQPIAAQSQSCSGTIAVLIPVNTSVVARNLFPPETTLEGIELASLAINKKIPESVSSPPNVVKDSSIVSPQSSRPVMDEHVADEPTLSEGYEICKSKYKINCSVSQSAHDAAVIIGRLEDTAKSWIKALREDDIETVFDLKLLVHKDWESFL